jgi:acetoin utilization deacetylase AcuC-like enzyme
MPADAIVYFYPEGHEGHFQVDHPERPERVERIRAELQSAGLWEMGTTLSPSPVNKEILQTIHAGWYLHFLQAACQTGEPLDGDTYTTPDSYPLAIRSAGGAISIADAVWHRKARRGFALTRPPGHHATPDRGMGFCLINNISLACEYLLQQGGASRLAIVDLDLHHGNGTQEIFWARDDVFFISIHQSPLYPGTGHLDETGGGLGSGFTANFPLPPASGDKAYLAVMDDLILPLLTRYQPEMVLVSYGFDPHWNDPLGHLRLSADGYGNLASRLASWVDGNCEGKLAFFLEGGYDLEAGAACSQAVVSALVGRPWKDEPGPSPHPEGKSWEMVVQKARQIWALT